MKDEIILNEIIELRKKYKQLEEERNRLILNKNRLINEINRLKEDLEQKYLKRNEVKAKLEEKRIERNNLINRLKIIGDEINNLKKEKDRILEFLKNYKYIKFKENEEGLKKKIEELEWYQQTNPLSKNEEKNVVEKIADLSRKLKIMEKLRYEERRYMEIKEEMAKRIIERKNVKDNITNVSMEINNLNEVFKEANTKIAKLRGEKEGISKEIDNINNRIKEILKEERGIIEKIVELQIEINKIRFLRIKEEETKILMELAKKAREKLERGERLSFEEFKALIEIDQKNQ
ncbi:MAG: hypothetical protein NZ926_02535 [Candidatus Methanomethylicia archaeon]|nr:hypothetical protein [Candidatus Methanomethylicia archaeon]MCX8169209.1 hypothetical protein [Candidatus Methanomethylicia archaeon]MDW7989009.1 hypothetical protein [Nitrososphaerota archaeon]